MNLLLILGSLVALALSFQNCSGGKFKTYFSESRSTAASQPVPDGVPGSENPKGTGFDSFVANALPVLNSSKCVSCHSGVRFSYASLTGNKAADYARFFPLLSLDQPEGSRLLAKVLPSSIEFSVPHAGFKFSDTRDPLYVSLKTWIDDEKKEKCGSCGLNSEFQWVAYVRQPAQFWSVSKYPTRTDWGLRNGARIFLQKTKTENGKMKIVPGAPVDFLSGSGFCENETCDFGNMSASYDGTRLAFECRLPDQGESYLEQSWNICVAEIDPVSGKAREPHLLMPAPLAGFTYARVTPFALSCFKEDPYAPGSCVSYGPDPDRRGFAVAGIYDRHGIYRQRHDLTPVFSPDGEHILFASHRPDPRTGEDSVQSYHGVMHLQNIVSSDLQGGNLKTIYRNEGGFADLPFFLKDGNLAFHAWALDRIDRNMYLQSTADGMVELPVLFGSSQGPNMWGKAFQLNNGLLLGLTGNRRGSVNNFQPFVADHTLGTGLDENFPSFRKIGPDLLSEFSAFPDSYCQSPPNGKNCSASQYFADPSWSPDGRALVAHNSSRTYFGNFNEASNEDGESFYTLYHNLGVASYLPKDMGISLLSAAGTAERLIANPAGFMLRYPLWIGKRQAPMLQAKRTDESAHGVNLHIADFKIWLSLQFNTRNKSGEVMTEFEKIRAVRILYKEMTGNACLSDAPLRTASNSGFDFDHPVPLGANNATGFVKYSVEPSAGGDSRGDVPLKSDNSVKLRVPAGRMLLLQGVDANGFVIAQRSRLFALPPRGGGEGNTVNVSVPKAQYNSQCLSCHGSIDATPYKNLSEFGNQSDFKALDFSVTEAAKSAAVNVEMSEKKIMSFKDQIRPLLDRKCVSCHGGESPAAGLSLQAAYSASGNQPAGFMRDIFNKSCNSYRGCGQYLTYTQQPVLSYNSSASFRWMLSPDDNPAYRNFYSAEISQDRAIASLSPWDLGYQNLMLASTSVSNQLPLTSAGTASHAGEYVFLSGNSDVNFGRGGAGFFAGKLSEKSYLVQILSGEKRDSLRTYTGSYNHSGLLTESELDTLKAVIDVGFPYMSRCDSKIVESGPYQGKPYGDPDVRNVPLSGK